MRQKLYYPVLFILTLLFFSSNNALSSVHIDLKGSGSRYNLDAENHESTSVSGSIAFGFFNYLRLGVTHRRSITHKDGYRITTSNGRSIYYSFDDKVETRTTSVDLTIFLYHGTISPFIFGGYAYKDYYIRYVQPDTIYNKHIKEPDSYRYGVGLSIRLNRDFQLKISQTFTPGKKLEIKDGIAEEEETIETYTEVGISYRLI